MKLKQIKKVLADSIGKYSTTIIKEEDGIKYEVEYALDLCKLDDPMKLLTAIFENKIFKEFEGVEVESIYCGEARFNVYLTGDNLISLFEKVSKQNKIPLTITKYPLIEE